MWSVVSRITSQTQRSTFSNSSLPPSFLTPLHTSAQSSSSHMAETPQQSSATVRRKVRVIARIRGAVQTPSKWISVSKSSNTSSISFLDHSVNTGKHTYELDHCYEPNDDNSTIYSAEIKPLVSSVFSGLCATVVAFGATASGKSYTIQGSDANPGLAVLAMEEILFVADRDAMSVAISYYEVYHDQVYDLLRKNESAVSVLENAQGKIQLKGLSQTVVKSLADFQKLYVNDSYKRNHKTASQQRRSHKGLMIHLFSNDGNKNDQLLVGRINFIDLAGFGDPQKKCINTYTLAENSRVNKSLYALQSVVYALNCNDSRVPYRDSKLTYMLRDSLGGKNKILMITCLNPTVCQDTIYMVNLASRCTKGNHRVLMDSLKKVKSAHKSMVNLSLKDEEKPVMNSSSKSAKYSGFKKKFTSTRLPLTEKRNNVGVSELKWDSGQFDEMKPVYTVEKVSAPLDIVLDTQQNPQECVSCLLDIESATVPATGTPETETRLEVSDNPVQEALPAAPEMEDHLEVSDSSVQHESLDIEEQMPSGDVGVSPPLSARLQELSNYLRSLQSATPLQADMLQESDTTNVEPKTPVARINNSVDSKWDDAVISSPWTAFNVRSAGVKKCLTEECVRFINSASKDELKGLKGIGDKRATYIMQLREKSPNHFKNIDDLQEVGLSAKQIKTMVKNIAGDMLFC